MMDRLRLIGHPVIVCVLICAFVYIYFVDLRGGNPTSFLSPPAPSVKTETESEWNVRPAHNPEVEPQGVNVVRQQDPLSPQSPLKQPIQPGVPQGNPQPGPPAQLNQNAPLQPIAMPDKMFQEGHWIGLEVIPLIPAVARANSIPPDVAGVLIDEVTLLSAEVGFLAGDVITAVNGKKVTDLKSFWQATKEVGQSNRANVSVYSGGKNKNIDVFTNEALGIAQMEAAPMILATDKSPHGRYGPCDQCHTISKTPQNTGQLAKDLGDVLTKVAPTIRKGMIPPHRKRGTCTLCHVVL